MSRRAANEQIRAVVKADGNDFFPFFCECEQPACGEVMWLPLAEFERLRERGQRVLAEAHVRGLAGARCSPGFPQ